MSERVQVFPKAPAPALSSFTPVQRELLQRKCACGGSSDRRGRCTECQNEGVSVQRRSANPTERSFVPPIVHEVLRSPGQPLDPAARSFMEPRFGHDFSRVKVHADGKAADSARAVNAQAYTVGHHVVFAGGQYTPGAYAGTRLLAHELAHVVQQGTGPTTIQAQAVQPADHPDEREADRAAETVAAGSMATIRRRASRPILHRAKGDMVAYSGSPSGALSILEKGKLIFATGAVSGHPGSKEFEKDEGPIPAGLYRMHPQLTQPTVSKKQKGTCGVDGIASGYQEITSNEESPCDDPTNHYCTVSCPTAGDPGQRCYTPKDCWGEKRMKIEGSAKVAKPSGGTVTRYGFYIHGGNHSVAVTSGCIKVFDDAVFSHLRTLIGMVPLCVGSACPPSVDAAITEAVRSRLEALWDLVAD